MDRVPSCSVRVSDVVTTKPEPEARSVSVEIGNHQVMLANPQLPQAFSLERLRNSEVVSIEAQELKLESRLYRLQTDTLDKAVSQETSALQDALASLNTLGKSEAAS